MSLTFTTPDEAREHRRELYTALRSGQYTQSTNSLRSPVGFCCLGVADDLYQNHHPDTSHWANLMFYVEADRDENGFLFGENNYLSPAVQEWYGFNNKNPVITCCDLVDDCDAGSRAADQNDSGSTFSQIADMMEKYYKDA